MPTKALLGECGLTPQYAHCIAKGLVVLGFPCNQFGGNEEQILDFCQTRFCSLAR